MSNHLISLAYKRNLRTPMRKSVMVLLADKASDDGSGIWASKQTMADELCCSKQSVISTIQDFLLEGLLVELGHRKSPNGFTVEYGINIDALAAIPLVNCHTGNQSETLTGQPAGPVKDVDVTGQPVGPKPSRTILPKKAKASLGERARQIGKFPLPANFIPTVSGRAAQIVAGWPPGALEDEIDHWRAYHERDGTLASNWDASFRTWVHNRKKWDRQDGRPRLLPETAAGRGARALQLLEQPDDFGARTG